MQLSGKFLIILSKLADSVLGNPVVPLFYHEVRTMLLDRVLCREKYQEWKCKIG